MQLVLAILSGFGYEGVNFCELKFGSCHLPLTRGQLHDPEHI